MSATASGGARPAPLVFAAVVLVVAGISLAGMITNVPLWLLSILLAAIGIGLANTGSLGLLVEAVPVERIVTAMVIWSQIGIIGYLLGPLAGGLVADGPGYALVGLVPAAAGLVLLTLLLNTVVKQTVRRARPVLEEELPALTPVLSGRSYPSAHASTSFAGARALGAAGLPNGPLRAVAFAMALSRPYLGVHYPSDVIAGALLGDAVARLMTP